MTQPTAIPAVTIKLPSLRSLQKLGRDALVAGIAALATFLSGPHGVGALNLGPEESALITSGFLFIYRWSRGLVGKEPS